MGCDEDDCGEDEDVAHPLAKGEAPFAPEMKLMTKVEGRRGHRCRQSVLEMMESWWTRWTPVMALPVMTGAGGDALGARYALSSDSSLLPVSLFCSGFFHSVRLRLNEGVPLFFHDRYGEGVSVAGKLEF